MSRSKIKNSEHLRENQSTKISVADARVLEYQLDCLRTEMDLIDRVIARLENYSQSAKNFTVAIWAGSITLLAGQPDLRKYLILTAVIPILFWFIDARWIYFTKGSIIRSEKISKYLNSPLLAESFKRGELVEFSIVFQVYFTSARSR